MKHDDAWLPRKDSRSFESRQAADCHGASLDPSVTLFGVAIDWKEERLLVRLGEKTIAMRGDVATALSDALYAGARAMDDGETYAWGLRSETGPTLAVMWDVGDEPRLGIGVLGVAWLFPRADEARRISEDLHKAMIDLSNGGGSPPES